jgi:hypothetical protein
MKRMALCVAAMVLPTAMLGCGGSGESGENQVPGEIQYQLGQNAQGQLQTVLHDKGLVVQAIRCGRLSAGEGACILSATESSGERGTLTVNVKIERGSRTLQARLAGTTNRRWMAMIQRQTQAQARAQGQAGAGAGGGIPAPSGQAPATGTTPAPATR